ncbi:restriction endonuclease subunit S [Faecalibacterium sp.]|uniref:restriction endonuclease subunit S n=1 Tax=Faecalibacterium sp. TaxID=1971605 RepID=UPI00399B1C04
MGATLNKATLSTIKIQLHEYDNQLEIVNMLNRVSSSIDFRKQQLTKLDELVKARFVEMFGDPVTNPFNWPAVELGQRCEIITGNTPSRAEPENYGTFIEWIKSDNINTPSTFLTPAQEYLSEVGFRKCRFVESGSLLMTCIAGSLNCIGNVAVTNRRVAFNQQINAITPTCDNVLYLYWLMILSKPAIHKTINMALKGILSKSQLSSIKFPFPSIECQNQFADFVAEVDKSKVEVQKALDQTQLLFDSLMQQYFG